jgi:dihydrofolate synthase/folylpolyglutamate synthase
MTYQESLDFLYQALPMFQRIGASAFKKDLSNTLKLCERLGNPQQALRCIHIAGTNGKGSTAHALASVLQTAGYKTGLYTSPHLKSFRERIKINGTEIPEAEVCRFVQLHRDFLEGLKPSFFEMTVAMAFDYFAREAVDYAVIETGMGGRLDSTNVVTPLLSLITNIGMDHVQFLGDSLDKIAGEKAGIIKEGVPVVIGQTQAETAPVFRQVAAQKKAILLFADERMTVLPKGMAAGQLPLRAVFEVREADGKTWELSMDLLGDYQARNLPAILLALDRLKGMGLRIWEEDIRTGLANIQANTGLKGRWQILHTHPRVICDTGHNIDGFRAILDQLASLTYRKLTLVLGMVADKDVDEILALLPRDASYVFCQADQPRSMPAHDLQQKALAQGLVGIVIADVNEALEFAKKNARPDDLIFVGGSTFVVAEINGL